MQFVFATRAIRLFVVGLLLLSSIQAQTSIVVYRTTKELVVGADSKTRLRNISQPNIITEIKTTCKIRQIGNSFISIAGQYNFDPYITAISTFRGRQSLADKAEAFRNAVTEQLRVMLTQIQPQPSLSVLGGVTTVSLVEATIFGVEHGVPSYIVLRLSIDVSLGGISDIRPYIYSCPGDCKGSISYFPTGRREALDKLSPMIDARFWKSFGSVNGIRFLIMIETEAASDEVGEPVDILRVTKDGVCWAGPKTKKDCDDAQIGDCKSPMKRPPKKAKR